jgi:HAD superfamily hydrolase (TIGR01509 family)
MTRPDLPAAVLFDFDGTILETEGPSYRSWQELFDEHGLELTLDAWSVTVGALNLVDPVAMLEEALGREVDGDGLRRRRMRRKLELVAEEALRPGVEQLIADARRHGLRLGIVTSASGDWVRRHLTRLHLDEAWDLIVAADGDPERAKPAPVVYLEALELLEIAADDAIAIEDSPNGVRTAKAAGIPCVAVPNPITRRLDLSEADVVLDTLDGAGVADLAAAAGTIQRT